jgi:branched-chain amino acid transport system ATP-binding protein
VSLLDVSKLRIAYGDMVAVRDVSFSIERGDVFVLLGANGAGKTSLLRCISGLIAPVHGSIMRDGYSLIGLRPHQVALRGVSHVPENRRIFTELTVVENLSVSFLPARSPRPLSQALDAVFTFFPRLSERRAQVAGTMSGGEQQMLAIGRAMMNTPDVLMLDEPSLGLSPLITEQVFAQLGRIGKSGTAILLVEQNAGALDLATRGLVLSNGEVVLAGDRAVLGDSSFVRRAYLGL